MLMVHDSNRTRPMSSIDLDYTKDTESFAIYWDKRPICRITHGNDCKSYSIEVFDAGLFAEHIERISNVLVLYAEH